MDIKLKINKVLKRNKLYYTKRNVMENIEGCRSDLGLPLPHYAGRGLIAVTCWGGRGEHPNTTLFIDAPKEEMEFIRMQNPDWKEIVEKYGTQKQKDKLLNIPIKVRTKYGVLEE